MSKAWLFHDKVLHFCPKEVIALDYNCSMEEISAPTSITPSAEEEIISPKMAEYHQVAGSPSSFDMMVAEPEAQMSHHPEKPKALIYAIFFGLVPSPRDS